MANLGPVSLLRSILGAGFGDLKGAGFARADGNALFVEGIGTEVGFVGPLDAAEERADRVEDFEVLQRAEDAFREIRFHVENADFAVGEREPQGVVGLRSDGFDARVELHGVI